MNQKRLADSLVRKFKTRDPFKIAEALGYIIIRTPLSGIRGYCQYVKRCNVIYIDNRLSHQDSAFVCAHELGHILMHRGYNRIFMDKHTYFVTSRYEAEADQFAVDLLFSDEDLEEFMEFPVQLTADFMGTNVALAEYRMKNIRPKEM